MKHVAISLAGPFVESVRAGFAKAGELIRQRGQGTVAVVVSSKKHLAGTVTEDFLGRKTCSELLKSGRIEIEKGFHLVLESSSTISRGTKADVILGLHVNSDTLAKATERNPSADVILVPWLESERDDFAKKHQAEIVEVEDPRPAELRESSKAK
jgi:hypothetical protein